MRIPFVGPAYQARSANVDAQRAVNCYLELDNASPRAPIALYGTSGLVLRFTVGDGPVRGGIQFSATCAHVVSGNGVYAVTYSAGAYSSTLLGGVYNSTGPIGMTTNGTQTLILDGAGGWLATATTFTQITDPDFPSGVSTCDYLDGYFVVGGDGSGRIYVNETPGVGADWNGTDFADAEGNPDATVRIIVDHREAWIVGGQTAEIWVDTGNPDFPLERSGNAFVQYGTGAPWSVAAMDNTIYMLGQDKNGFGVVYKMQGYTPVRISTHAIEKVIQGYETTSDAQAFCYQIEGHAFYVLTFPSADATWVYDAATSQWHQWAYRNPSSGVIGRHRSNCHLFFNGEHLVGDFENGKVYALDLDTFTDNGDAILRLRATQCLESDQQRLFFHDLQVDMETGEGLATGQGSAPLLMMRYSNDGGHTWSDIRTTTVGRAGEYGMRARFTRLGQGRNRVWEISMTDPVKFAVLGGLVKFSKGTS